MSIKKISMSKSKMKFKFLKEETNRELGSKGTVTVAKYTKTLVDENPLSI
jgi:hypothetical protein